MERRDGCQIKDDPIGNALRAIEGKWKIPVMYVLCKQKSMRYSELRKALDITNMMLTSTLKELEADRAYIFEFDMQHNTSKNTYEICADTVPPQIEYLQHIPNEDIPWLYSQMQEDKLLITEDLRVTQKSNLKKSATSCWSKELSLCSSPPFM